MKDKNATQQALIPDDGPSEHRLRQYGADFTPYGIVRQCFKEIIIGRVGALNVHILDPFAGAGVFAQVGRPILDNPAIRDRWEATEIRVEEKLNIAHHYDLYRMASYTQCRRQAYDLIISNPDFGCIREAVAFLRGRLTSRGILVFLCHDGFGQRSVDGAAFFREHTPIQQWRIPGTISFRGRGTGADTRNYSWWIWDNRIAPQCRWDTYQLPGPLPARDRTWRVRPGTGWNL